VLPGDMLSVDSDSDAAVKARVRKGWNTFTQLVTRDAESTFFCGTPTPTPGF